MAFGAAFTPRAAALDPGEPALGPPTYMHRLLACDLADAPIAPDPPKARQESVLTLTVRVTFSMPGPWRVTVTVPPPGGGTPLTKPLDYGVGP